MDYNCKRCPKCRQETSADNDFCPFCGHAFKGTNHRAKRKSGFGRKSLPSAVIVPFNIFSAPSNFIYYMLLFYVII